MSLNSYLVTDEIRPLPGSGWTSKNAANAQDSITKENPSKEPKPINVVAPDGYVPRKFQENVSLGVKERRNKYLNKKIK